MKTGPQIDLIMLNTPRQNFVKPNGFGDFCKKLLSDPYVLFLVMAAMFFDGSKIPTSVLYQIPQGISIQSLVPISRVVSEKSFKQLFKMTTTDNNSSHGLWQGELKI